MPSAMPGNASAAATAPLAERLRPAALAEVVGQPGLLDPGRPLARALGLGRAHSMILWGPPGVGKTTLARLIAERFGGRFIALSAVLAGVKDLRQVVDEATSARAADPAARTVLFVDEIHRFNKAQQDALLPHVESGLVTLIGATTENPAFEVNSALLSRAQVYVLESLGREALAEMYRRAVAVGAVPDAFTPEAVARLAEMADGDGRRFLNLLEQASAAVSPVGGAKPVEADEIPALVARAGRRFDKGGDAFHDQISALHKSVRGSHPDAALYWFMRMLDGGADPTYLSRRIVRMAWEDIGLADPRAFSVVTEAAATFERLGSPEGELALAQAVLYLAVAPKSNAGYQAFKAAKAFVAQDTSRPVPNHLRNAPSKLARSLGHGVAYRYAHDEADGYAAGERYLPEGMDEPGWYQPTPRGLEGKIAEKLARLRRADVAADARSTPTGSGGDDE